MTNAVDDVVEQLAIAHSLHHRITQIRCSRILPRCDLGLAAAVVCVADLAFLAINLSSRHDIAGVRVRS